MGCTPGWRAHAICENGGGAFHNSSLTRRRHGGTVDVHLRRHVREREGPAWLRNVNTPDTAHDFTRRLARGHGARSAATRREQRGDERRRERTQTATAAAADRSHGRGRCSRGLRARFAHPMREARILSRPPPRDWWGAAVARRRVSLRDTARSVAPSAHRAHECLAHARSLHPHPAPGPSATPRPYRREHPPQHARRKAVFVGPKCFLLFKGLAIP